METEEKIIYQILNVWRASQPNNDEPIDEREIRTLLRNYRSALISKTYQKGILAEGVIYQTLGDVDIVLIAGYYTFTLPQVIRLKHNTGLKVTTVSGYNIPILSRESFFLAKKNPLNNYQPKGFIEGNTLNIYQGLIGDEFMSEGTVLDNVIDELSDDKKIHIEAILQSPEDGLSYDWTTSIYPLSEELIKRKHLN